MQVFDFLSPVHAHFGFGSISRLKTILSPYQKICVVSGRTSLDSSGFREYLESNFHDKSFFFFNRVEENPSIETVLSGASFAIENRCEVVVGFGGGSPLDASKAIAYFATNQGSFYDHLNATGYVASLPLIAIPSTCGTGSEMNHYSIITDREKVDKINFSNSGTFPRYALLDPTFLRSLKTELLFATAFDAFTHCMEGYISRRSNPFSDILAIRGMEMLLSSFEKGDTIQDETLSDFLFASALGGVTIIHTGTTFLHALGYYLTNKKGIHHGTANAILLPAFLKMLHLNKVGKYNHVASLLEKHNLNLPYWIEKMGQSSKISDILTPSEMEKMVDYALGKKNTESTPFPLDRDFVLESFSQSR